jgi:hypothetical protein
MARLMSSGQLQVEKDVNQFADATVESDQMQIQC